MSPRFYGSLWVLFFISAGVIGLADGFTLNTLIVYGFVAFGLVFAGMMCVLPGVVSHPAQKREAQPPRKRAAEAAMQPALAVPAGQTQFPIGLHSH